eukprot:1546736-Pleurochrysis_carterae.AAC.1
MKGQQQQSQVKQAVDNAGTPAPPPQQPPTNSSASFFLPHTPTPDACRAQSKGGFQAGSASSASQNYTPPDLVCKRQTLSGLLAVHAADPTCAARAGMIAELRYEIERLERKRVRLAE